MNTKSKFSILVILLLLTINIFGQNGDPCSCNIAIPQNLRDEITSIRDFKYSNVDSVIFSHDFNYWEKGEWHNDKNMQSGGQAYADLFSGFLNASTSEGGKEAKFNSMKSYYNMHKEVKISDYIYISQKTASHVAYDKWIQCKLECPNVNQVIIKITSRIEGEVTVNLTVMDNQNTSPVDLHHIHLDNVKIKKSSEIQEKTRKLVPRRPYSTTFQLKNPNVDGIVEINIGNYTTEPIIIPRKNGVISIKPSQPSNAKIEIENGEINEHSRVSSSGIGTGAVDTAGPQREVWRSMPWAGGGGTYDGSASVNTTPNIKVLVDNKDNYQWRLEIVTLINTYCRGGGNPTGGRGQAAPQYITKIKLPQLDSSESYWAITLKAGTYVNIDNDNSLGSVGSVTLTGMGLTKTISFAVNRTHDSKILPIDSLKPGDYSLELQAPVLLTTCEGPSPEEHKATYTTTLSADILAKKVKKVVNPEPTPKSYSIYYWIGGILLLLLGIFYVYSKRKKRKND